MATAALVAVGFMPLVVTSPASAQAPVFSFSESAPSTVLYGTPATVSLTATETNSVTGFNLTMEDVLPAGVSYVTGSTTPGSLGGPQVLADEPVTGKTTLIWSNVSDLQPSSSFVLGFQLQGAIDTTVPTPTTILYPGDSYTDSASAYIEADPRYVPQFNADGSAVASSYTTEQSASANTEISPLETTVTDPLPEHELERGVHDQQKIWTLTVTNNDVHATALDEMDAWLPAGLEFLGCGGVDNTDSPTTTYPSDAGPAPYLEYPGAPDLTSGAITTSGNPVDDVSSAPCVLPTMVSTEDTVVPPGLTSASNESNPVYTQAQWVFGTGTGDLTPTTLQPGDTYTIRYLAAVPLLENTMTFNDGTPAGADAEASNLDNNNGADTLSLSTGTGSDQTTAAQATGTYDGTLGSGSNPTSASGQDTVTIHDLAIQKAVSSSDFVEGSDVTFSLYYETSEYRYSQSAVITDSLPNGLCPIDSTTNYDQDASTDCAPQAGKDPSLAYTSVVENDGTLAPAGSFTLTWELGTLPTDLDGTISYTAVDRSYYQQYSASAFGPAAPTLTGDSFSNTVGITSDTYATCENGGAPDAECSDGGSLAIYSSGEPGGPGAPSADAAAESNPSSAGQVAGQPTISKEIAAPVPDGGGITCAGASYSTTTTLVFQQGDVACFQLTVDFPAGLYTRDPVVEDYLPPNSTYVGTGTDGSAATGADTVTIATPVPSSPVATSNGDQGSASNPVVKATSDGDLLTWYLGSSIATTGNSSIYAFPGQVFQYDIGTTIEGPPNAGNTFELTQNLMKFTSFNTPGLAVADRNDAPYTLQAPSVTLLKGVESDGTTTNATGNTVVGGSFDSNVDHVRVVDGGNAVFRVDVSNWDLYEPVYSPTIWDVLQSGQTCADVSNIEVAGNPAGTCYDAGAPALTGIGGGSVDVTHPTIVWTGADIASVPEAASSTVPGEVTLTYQYDVPLGAATGDIFNDEAGVVSYAAQPDTGSTNDVTYYPTTNNIATSDGFSLPGSPGADQADAPNPPGTTVEEDPSNVYVHDPEISKAVDPISATIGQDVKYTLTATSPTGGALYGGVVTDSLGTRLTYDPSGPYGVATASCSGGAIAGGPYSPALNGAAAGGFSFSEVGNTFTLDWPDLAKSTTDAICTVIFDATVADVAANYRGQNVPNSASFAYKNESGGTGTGSAQSSSTVDVTVTEPDVALAKTDSDAGNPVPHQALPGATVTYTLTLSNQDLADVSSASDMVVTDCVQDGATYVAGSSTITVPGQSVLSGAGAEPASGACAGGTQLTWTLNTLYSGAVTLAKNASATISYETTLPASPVGYDTYPNSATFTVTSLDTTASPRARTAATATAESISGYSAGASDTVTVPGTIVSKMASPTSGAVGVDSTFTATVTVPAGLNFPDLTAVDVLPDGMTFDSYVSASCEDVTVPADPCGTDISDITTEAPVYASSSGQTSIAWWIGNVDASSDQRVVTLTYTAYPSETYHTDVAVSSGNTLTNTIGAYWADSTASATADAPAPSGGPSFGFPHQSGTETAAVTVLAPSLSVVKSANVLHPTPDETIPYTVEVENGSTDSSTAYLTTVTDPVPSLLAVSPGSISDGGMLSGANGDGTGGTITWTLTGDTIAAGSSLNLTYDATIAPSDDFSTATEASAIQNTATVGTYYAVTNATATAAASRYDAYGPAQGSASVTPVFPSLAVVKYTGSAGTSLNGTTNIGEATSWHLAVTDNSAASVQDLAVVDTLPPYWTYDPGSTSIATESVGVVTADPAISTSSNVETLTWSNLGTLDSTHSVTVAYQATPGVGAQLDAPGNINSAYATAEDVTGAPGVGTAGTFSAYQSATATANDTIPKADLSISKTNGASFVSGANGTYAIAVTNNGPDPAAEPITVTDVVPAGESYVSASGSGWACGYENADATVTCTFGSSGQSAAEGTVGGQISLVVGVSSSVTPGVAAVTNTASVTDNGTYDPVPSNNSSADATTVVGADLSISKTHSSGITAGQGVTYSIVVTNNGPASSAGSITVTDVLPGTETLASAPTGTGWSCSGTSTVTCTHAGAIADGASATTISLPVNVSSAATGTITNTATVAPGPTDDPNPLNNSSSDAATVLTSANLNIAKTLTLPAGGLVSGEDATYNIQVNNAGPSDAIAPEVQDVLPAGETYMSATGTDWTCGNSSGTVTCTYTAAGTLPEGASASQITLTVHVSSADVASITNTAIVCSGTIGSGSNPCTGSVDANGTPDPATANNTSSAGSSAAVGADLTITKTHSGDFVSGSTGTYSITVTDNGPADSVGTAGSPIVVTDTLPSGESYVSATGTGWACAAASQIVTCDYASRIVADTSAPTISLVVAIGSSPSLLGTLTNSVQVTPGVTTDGDPGNNSASDPTTIDGADLSIAKSHTGNFVAGADGTYSIVVTNKGPAYSAGPITVTDTLPSGESFVSASGTGWTCSDGSGTASDVVTCTSSAGAPANAAMGQISLVVAVGAGTTGTLTNTAEVVPGSTADPVTSNNSASDPTTIATSADLSIEKTLTSPAGGQISGKEATYTINVNNLGPSDAIAPQVQDVLPASESFISASGTGWGCDNAAGTVTCTYSAGPTLAVGASASPITLDVSVKPGIVAPIVNTAIVCSGTIGTGTNPCAGAVESNGTPDPVTSNNTSSVSSAPSASADLVVTKSHTGEVVAGANATYSIVVSNNGPGTSVGPISVVDTLPSGESFVSASGSGWTCSDGAGSASATVTCQNPSGVADKASMAPIGLVVAVGADVTGTLVNSAKVIPGPTVDLVPSNNTASDPATVVTEADLTITKTNSGDFVLGGHGTYSLAVANKGPSVAAGPITVTDPLPEGETFVSADGTGWTCKSAAGGPSSQPTVTCSRPATLDPGASAPVISLTVDVGPGAYPSVTNTAKVSSPTSDPDTANNSSSDTLSPTPVAVLKITKTLTGTLTAGAQALYSIVVTDAGPSAATQVVVTDPMPSGLVPISGTGPGWRCGTVTGTNELECTRAVLDVNEPSTIIIAALVTAKAGEHVVNTASVASATAALASAISTSRATTPDIEVKGASGSSKPTGPTTKPGKPGKPSKPLAFTGFAATPVSAAGLLLVLSGLATLEVARRRREPVGSRR
jgi:fimbrial isopeptide formation D2 family protein/uncharacterized repeat protein (TIGR01451 family)